MDTRGTFAADLILASPKAYAAGAVERHRSARPGLVEAYRQYGFADLMEDTQVRLQYLCEALAAGRVELFRDHVGWLKATFKAKEAPEDFLRESLEHLAEELRESLPAEAAGMAGDYVADGIEFLERAPDEIPTLLEGDAPHRELTRHYLLAVLENRADDAVQLLVDAADLGVPVGEIFATVLQRSQQEIGRMWQVGEITVAEEHCGSRIAERVLVELRSRMTVGEPLDKRVICTSVAGNQHDLGSRIVAAHFDMAGWSSILLGANMPMADLTQAILDFEAHLVALSATLVLQVRATGTLIRHVRSVPSCKDVPIVVGGRPFELVADLWTVVGADGMAENAGRAVQVGARLVEQA